MASKKVQDFFKNKVTIRLKNGHQFRGLLNSVDNKNGVVVLEDIEDLGNAYDKELLPSDKKLIEKKFQAQIIEEIILTDKVFADPKKYNRDDFFDSMTEHKELKYPREQKGQRDFNKPRGAYQGRGGRGGKQSDYRNKKQREYKPRKNYESKEQKRQQQDDERQYR